MTEPQPIRLVLADDQELIRLGFRMVLEAVPGIAVVGEAADGEAALEQVAALRPDVVLMDVRMPGVDGIEATRRLMALPAEQTHPHVLMLTTFDIDEYVYEAMRAGASGFLLKDSPPAELAAGVRIVARGDALLDPAVTRRVIEHFVRAGEAMPAPVALDALTPREREVLVLVAHGMSNREIAGELVLAEQTVRSHVSRILTKLQLRDRAQAVVAAYESGLVVPSE